MLLVIEGAEAAATLCLSFIARFCMLETCSFAMVCKILHSLSPWFALGAWFLHPCQLLSKVAHGALALQFCVCTYVLVCVCGGGVYVFLSSFTPSLFFTFYMWGIVECLEGHNHNYWMYMVSICWLWVISLSHTHTHMQCFSPIATNMASNTSGNNFNLYTTILFSWDHHSKT